MILMIGGNRTGREVSLEIERQGYRIISLIETVADAALYGRGEVVTGTLDRDRIKKIVQENEIRGVLDVTEGEYTTGLNALKLCGELGIPFAKFESQGIDFKLHKDIAFCYTRDMALERLNADRGNILVWVDHHKTPDILWDVTDKKRLFTIVLKGTKMSVDELVDWGIHVNNIIELDGVYNLEENAKIISRFDIEKIFTLTGVEMHKKIELAGLIGAGVIALRAGKVEYPLVLTDYGQAVECVMEWNLM